jgi:hypothetical protein
MSKQQKAMCPLFPDVECPQGAAASKKCNVRVNGEFDPVLYFRDELIMHCAIYQNKMKSEKDNKAING